MKKIRIGFILAVTFLFLSSAFAADPVQPAEAESCMKFTFDAGPIVMTRHQSDKALMSGPGRAGSGDIMKSSMVDDEWRVGGQARLSVAFPCFYLDFGGFWIPSGSDSVDRIVPAGVSTIETSPITTFGGPTDGDATFKYSSSIYNLDGSIGHSFAPWFSAYAGVRYMRLKEKLSMFFPFDFGDQAVDWKTKNSLVGPQIGARASILKVMGVSESSPWSLDTNVTFALLHNHASSDCVRRVGSVTSNSESSNFWTPGVAAEADLGYRLTRNLKLAVGYQMLYIDRVALATGQVGKTGTLNVAPPTANSVGKDSVLYHGGIVRFVVDLP